MTTATQKSESSEKPAAKKRGGYSFSGATPISSAPSAKKSAAKAKKPAGKASSKKKAPRPAAKPAAKQASKAAAKPAAKSSAKNSFDLGLASIARSTSNATRQTANTVNDSVERGSKAIRGAYANATSNARQVQDKFTGYGKEIQNNLTQTANRAAQNANRSLELGRENAEAAAQSYKAATQNAQKASQELFNYINNSFAQNVEAARQALSCRNVNELFELQSETARSNIESAISQAIRMSEMAVQAASKAMEPINESVARNSKKLSEFVA